MKTRIFKVSETTEEVLKETAAALKAGAVIVMPTETVYGIAAAADNPAAVDRMCGIKNKPADVPLQYLAADVNAAKKLAVFPPEAGRLAAAFWPGGITLVLRPSEEGKKIARGFDTVGVRVPDNKFAVKILKAFGGVLAASSANTHGAPLINEEKELLKLFAGKADYIFTGGVIKGTASTVLSVTPFKIFRRGVISEEEILKKMIP